MPVTKPPARLLILAALLLLAGCGGGGGSGAGPLPLPPPRPAAAPPLLVLGAVGDTGGFTDDDPDPLAGVAHLLADLDLFLYNHEGVLRATPPPPEFEPHPANGVVIWSRPELTEMMRFAPLTVATLANNHVLDTGGPGLEETLASLGDRGVIAVGAGADLATAKSPVRLSVSGIEVGIAAYLAIGVDGFEAGPAAPGAAPWDPVTSPEEIEALAAGSDFVVASLHLHYGRGWTDVPSPENLAVVHAALDAGADLVIGHGPHVLQGVLVKDGRVALLSTGNFLFRLPYRMPADALRSAVARLELHADRIDLTLFPVSMIPDGIPAVPDEKEGDRILKNLADNSGLLGTEIEVFRGEARLSVPR